MVFDVALQTVETYCFALGEAHVEQLEAEFVAEVKVLPSEQGEHAPFVPSVEEIPAL